MIDFSGVDKESKIQAFRERLEFIDNEISAKCHEHGIDEILVKSGNYRHGLDSPLTYHEQLQDMSKNYVNLSSKIKELEEL